MLETTNRPIFQSSVEKMAGKQIYSRQMMFIRACIVLVVMGVLVGGMIVGGLFLSGYWDSKKPAGSGAAAGKPPAAKPKPAMHNWPKPAFAIVFSGEQDGHMEPCGCTVNQMGGLSHSHDLLRQMKKRGWPTTSLNLGGAIYDRGSQSPRKLDELKLQSFLKAFELLGYGALGLGLSELKMARDTDVLLLQTNLGLDEKDDKGKVTDAVKTPFVSANVVVDQDVGPRRTQLIRLGGKIIGVTSIVSTSYQRKILPVGSKSKPAMTDPNKALKTAVAAMKKAKSDFLVLLSQGTPKEAEQFAKKFPDFDVILTAGGSQEGSFKPTIVGKTSIIAVGIKGKHVGVMGFYPTNAKQKTRFELVDLDGDRFKNSKEMHNVMKEYQAMLKDNHADVFADLEFGAHPSGSTYVGAETCGECHTKSYAKWEKTRHAHGYKSLLEGRVDQRKNWVKRHYDPECLSCHVTGWDPQKVSRYKSGFQTKELAGKNQLLFTQLRGQQCENCHGPGSQHVALEEADDNKAKQATFRLQMRVTKADAKKSLCVQCHDLDNSPKYKFETYWKKIEHPGKD